MKIAYLSPLNPQRSGISDYSEELLKELLEFADIDLFVEGFWPDSSFIKQNFRVNSISSFTKSEYSTYDEVIYHIGNNVNFHEHIYACALKYPGIVVLHDYSIHDFIINLTVGKGDWESYLHEMYYNYGDEGVYLARNASQGKSGLMWGTDKTLQYPLNKRLIDSSKGMIVHSKVAYDGIIQTKESAFVQYAPLFTNDIKVISETDKLDLRNKYNVKPDIFIFASFGYVTKVKRISAVLHVLNKLKNNGYKNFAYLIVGEKEQGYDEIEQLVKKYKLQDECKLVGFVDLEVFKDYIKLSDVCINLRYPTQGETSASLLRILGYGKPAIVSNIGSFSEFPDDCTIKIRCESEKDEGEDLFNAMVLFLTDKNMVTEMGKNAINTIVNHHSVKNTSDAYLQAVLAIRENRAFTGEPRFYFDYIDNFVLSSKDIMDYSMEFRENVAKNFSEFIEKKGGADSSEV
ncbi:glycosyltransferase [Cohnella ginsengisoli]|uniref:Glycosyltransferase n=1 Tax=Cohnella ginsengisoli TaxID=425004 RepID=A0A9X4KLS0_9BACL|nr:glycosyltransferase [Cohnella ginsengisoli]MDG0794532.1 glycosyltransferase [Cohnella ginsengisoli]